MMAQTAYPHHLRLCLSLLSPLLPSCSLSSHVRVLLAVSNALSFHAYLAGMKKKNGEYLSTKKGWSQRNRSKAFNEHDLRFRWQSCPRLPPFARLDVGPSFLVSTALVVAERSLEFESQQKKRRGKARQMMATFSH